MSNGLVGGLCALVILCTACDPPGKPGIEIPSQNITDFKTLYTDNCSGCLGMGGKNGPGRILNDPLYLAILPKAILKQILIYGRAGTAMPPWAISQGGPLTDKQIDALVKGIESNWAKPVDFHGAQPPAYAVGSDKGDGDAGRKLFLRNCFMCHGPGARVGAVTGAAYLSLVSNQMLRTSIIVGRPDLGMPDYRMLKLGKPLSDGDITDLVAFLASKRPVNATTAKLAEQTMPGAEVTPGNEEEQQAGGNGHVNDAGTGQHGATGKGNEGSGNGPGSPRQQKGEGNKSTGASSQQGIK
ncbi:MAG: cytochrome c [Acidobacteriota bacterium]|nr:cytochrome c [Acidobacteriota bacterium]